MAPSDSPILQRLDCLNVTSSDFGDQLYDVLRGQEYMECVLGLDRNDIVWLVDYLDNVRRCTVLSRSLHNLDLGSQFSRTFWRPFPKVSP